jgi:predicted CoA-binding protein
MIKKGTSMASTLNENGYHYIVEQIEMQLIIISVESTTATKANLTRSRAQLAIMAVEQQETLRKGTYMANVVVVGASNNPQRYAYQAMQLLAEYGHNPLPVAVARDTILQRPVYASVAEVRELIDTVTLYIGVKHQPAVLEQIIAQHPRRVIFNPGTENPTEYDRLRAAGIEVCQACTLVLLRSGQF